MAFPNQRPNLAPGGQPLAAPGGAPGLGAAAPGLAAPAGAAPLGAAPPGPAIPRRKKLPTDKTRGAFESGMISPAIMARMLQR
jgi:hypothetical protein